MSIKTLILVIVSVLSLHQRVEALVIHSSTFLGQAAVHEELGNNFELTRGDLTGDGKERQIPYWDHVGMVGMGSGVYLGGGYVLTSAHVGCHPFRMMDGRFYRPDYKSWRVLTNPNGEKSDLAVYRVSIPAGDPGLGKLGNLPICEGVDKIDGPLLMIGTGYVENRKSSSKGSGSTNIILGHQIKAQREKRWGINFLDKVMDKPVATTGGYKTQCFASNFDRKEGEAQAADGDSGGATFVFNKAAGRWELAGCIIAASQLAQYVPFGARTYLGDLGAYRQQLPGIEKTILPNEFENLLMLADAGGVKTPEKSLYSSQLNEFNDVHPLWLGSGMKGGGLFPALYAGPLSLPPVGSTSLTGNP